MTVPDASQPSGKWDVVYKPDLGVIRHDNPAPWGAHDQHAFEGVCDICVEEISDATLEEVRRDTREKKRGYAIAGVKEYYILDPEDRYMHFYRLTADRRYENIQPDAAGIIRSNVLPGFQFRRADLLKQPPLAELALDEIYANYLFPGYLDSVKRIAAATAARKQAEDRAAAATAARNQAEEQAQALKAELARLRRQSSCPQTNPNTGRSPPSTASHQPQSPPSRPFADQIAVLRVPPRPPRKMETCPPRPSAAQNVGAPLVGALVPTPICDNTPSRKTNMPPAPLRVPADPMAVH